jgi:hypothetical protein
MVDQLSGFFRTHLYQSESIRTCDANYYRHFEAICSHLTASATIKIRLLISGSQVRALLGSPLFSKRVKGGQK